MTVCAPKWLCGIPRAAQDQRPSVQVYLRAYVCSRVAVCICAPNGYAFGFLFISLSPGWQEGDREAWGGAGSFSAFADRC